MDPRWYKASQGKSASQGGLNTNEIKQILIEAGMQPAAKRKGLEAQLRELLTGPVTKLTGQMAALTMPQTHEFYLDDLPPSDKKRGLIYFSNMLIDQAEELDLPTLNQILKHLNHSSIFYYFETDQSLLLTFNLTDTYEFTFNQRGNILDSIEPMRQPDVFFKNYLQFFDNLIELYLDTDLAPGLALQTETFENPPPNLKVIGLPYWGNVKLADGTEIMRPAWQLVSTVEEIQVTETQWTEPELLATFVLPYNLKTIKLSIREEDGSLTVTLPALDLMIDKLNVECPNFTGFNYDYASDFTFVPTKERDFPADFELQNYIDQRILPPEEKILVKAAR